MWNSFLNGGKSIDLKLHVKSSNNISYTNYLVKGIFFDLAFKTLKVQVYCVLLLVMYISIVAIFGLLYNPMWLFFRVFLAQYMILLLVR